jgi:hypothetical protein
MSGVSRAILGSALAVTATLLLAALSRAPQHAGADADALLRLSWSGQPERVEVCRTVTEDELATLPQHMRQAVVCEGRSAEYHLRVTLDGTTVADEPVSGGGARGDRPIYLYREFALTPGTHALALRFTLTDSTAASAVARPRFDALPRTLALDTTLTLGPRAVALVTFEAGEGALVVRTTPTENR